MKEFIIKNEEDTRAFGCDLAKSLKPGDVIAMIGDLGTGKTTLTKYIAAGLGIEETVTSPTFTVVQEYKSGRLPLYHFDVYRVNDPDELFEIGFEEYLYSDGAVIVEWGDLVYDLLPEHSIILQLEYGEGEGERIYKIAEKEELKCTF